MTDGTKSLKESLKPRVNAQLVGRRQYFTPKTSHIVQNLVATILLFNVMFVGMLPVTKVAKEE